MVSFVTSTFRGFRNIVQSARTYHHLDGYGFGILTAQLERLSRSLTRTASANPRTPLQSRFTLVSRLSLHPPIQPH